MGYVCLDSEILTNRLLLFRQFPNTYFSTDQQDQYADTVTISALNEGMRTWNTSEQFMRYGVRFENV